jgi:hypothetical protein
VQKVVICASAYLSAAGEGAIKNRLIKEIGKSADIDIFFDYALTLKRTYTKLRSKR